jgi:hypothetical protein
VQASDDKTVPCVFCGESIVGRDFVLCSACDVPAHRECWTQAGRCPAYACGNREHLEPAVAMYRRREVVLRHPPPVPVARPPARPTRSEQIQTLTNNVRDLAQRIDHRVQKFTAYYYGTLIVFLTWFLVSHPWWAHRFPGRWIWMLLLLLFGPPRYIRHVTDPESQNLLGAMQNRLNQLQIDEMLEASGESHRDVATPPRQITKQPEKLRHGDTETTEEHGDKSS